jgi:ribonuclease-3
MTFILSDLEGKLLFYDAKSTLQEKVQEKGGSVHYKLIGEEGPGHNKLFRAAVYEDDHFLAEGEGKTKKNAEQHAALKALKSYETSI